MLETEIKKLTEAVVALTLAIQSSPTGVQPQQNNGYGEPHPGGMQEQPQQRPMTAQEFMQQQGQGQQYPPLQGPGQLPQQQPQGQTMGGFTPPPLPEGGPKTIEDVRNFLTPIMKERGNAFVMQLMNNFGYQQLSQIPPERYAEFANTVAIANAQAHGR